MTALLEDKYSIFQHFHFSASQTPYQYNWGSCYRQNTNLTWPHTKVFLFPLSCFSFFFGPLRSARPYCEASLKGMLHQSLFGQKIHIATHLPTKISLVCWCDNLRKQDHTRPWGQTAATASRIPHFSLMSTCIHSNKTPVCMLKNNKFGSLVF